MLTGRKPGRRLDSAYRRPAAPAQTSLPPRKAEALGRKPGILTGDNIMATVVRKAILAGFRRPQAAKRIDGRRQPA